MPSTFFNWNFVNFAKPLSRFCKNESNKYFLNVLPGLVAPNQAVPWPEEAMGSVARRTGGSLQLDRAVAHSTIRLRATPWTRQTRVGV